MRPETIEKIAPWVAAAVDATGGTHTVAGLVEAARTLGARRGEVHLASALPHVLECRCRGKDLE